MSPIGTTRTLRVRRVTEMTTPCSGRTQRVARYRRTIETDLSCRYDPVQFSGGLSSRLC